jgi:hypothetical protein
MTRSVATLAPCGSVAVRVTVALPTSPSVGLPVNATHEKNINTGSVPLLMMTAY